MEYYFSPHAEERLLERKISRKLIAEALHNPTQVSYDESNRLMIRKLYRKRGKDRLLIIVAEEMASKLKIITIIDTSKVKKYL